ncbi:hypothetical protein HaLaN_07698, partial [Haematococcus lacustris]|jgi:electron transfer flavoprotein alpha subunit
MQVG